jgi:hypothetical protein
MSTMLESRSRSDSSHRRRPAETAKNSAQTGGEKLGLVMRQIAWNQTLLSRYLYPDRRGPV